MDLNVNLLVLYLYFQGVVTLLWQTQSFLAHICFTFHVRAAWEDNPWR